MQTRSRSRRKSPLRELPMTQKRRTSKPKRQLQIKHTIQK